MAAEKLELTITDPAKDRYVYKALEELMNELAVSTVDHSFAWAPATGVKL